ncbi:biotin-dependent carboxyltransferase family protein [Paenibacillus sp. FJAT-27812]|uniref:5-oxoprolinase subunit C family protein n=1 Tax=Paenibacillus sp. FJAT-27812 TaxID=1684143 RepID=UPI0006A7AE35|nr:biotin-dependent carboxyltransferase family protein [Paenibacillus sp. FJAT-27812]
MSIKVVRPGLLVTVQDLGRFRYQKYGVVAGGAMDTGASRAANLLVGNEGHEAVLEITLTGTELVLEQDTLLAICGARMLVTADGEELPLWRPALVRAGTVIKFGACESGCRSYFAVAGGWDVPEVMGSKSTYLRGAIGGYKGRALKAGDVLAAGDPSLLSERMKESLQIGWRGYGSFAVPLWHASHFAIADNLADPIIRALPGTHYERFTAESKSRLFSQSFQISVQSDRMGYRLEGNHKLELAAPLELLSEAVASGTIQVPADGNPIVLLADRQTTGGYPRIGQVATVDIAVFAQLKPGDRFRFEWITQQEAEELYLDSERDLRMLKAAVALKFNSAN